MAVGIHVLGTLHGCPRELLEKVAVVRKIMLETVQEASFHSVGESFHQFKPVGVTGVCVLSESHFSVHTWPEKNLVTVDIFTCGEEGNAENGFALLCKKLRPEKIEKQVIKR